VEELPPLPLKLNHICPIQIQILSTSYQVEEVKPRPSYQVVWQGILEHSFTMVVMN
jgi:hypothetical protein